MTTLKIITQQNTEKGNIKLPEQFNEPVRADLIKRAVESIQSHKRQTYGPDPEAGTKAVISITKRRRKYTTTYGKGISRIAKKTMSRRGSQMRWVAAYVPGTVKGRIAHPPKLEKNWFKKINNKERRKAIRSALNATIQKEIVKERGHFVPEKYPFILSEEIEKINKTKEVEEFLKKIGLEQELERTNQAKIRAGRGKNRGRKYKTKKGPLIVVSGDCELLKSAKNIRGIDIIKANQLNVELLAPGTKPGRLTIYTDKAIKEIETKKLFS